MMMALVFMILLFMVSSTQGQEQHVFNVINARSETEEFNMTIVVDDNEYLHVYLNNKEGVVTLPEWVNYVDCPICVRVAESRRADLNNDIKLFSLETPEAKVPPEIKLYAKDEVKLGINNSLVCFVNNFFPPPVQVKWTKNDENIPKGVKVGQYATNSDYTFYRFSTLTFEPQEGDIYTCIVDHTALDEPLTRTWEFEVPPRASVGPAVFCGLGLTLGLLGVATGTFFLVKGTQCQ
ncbi:H-2 class II histocompatibility antigen, A-Q alpha chain isoform X1 [Salmo trutta]|uniref:Rano class II histocompatibility antigen, B alpha chain-like n=2 Tax=Salmo trutta TaxID=8032 RepID=A0A674CRZ7_SALTR|nr:H-2 class II histocompatibility antigen, A-Q alpha chain-like isoform X1 [Salmo trutta]